MSVSLLTRRQVRHALGYIGLGMYREAAAELDAVVAAEKPLPEVRSVRLDLCMAAKQWADAVKVGSALAGDHPACENAWIGWAYALRELQRVPEARDILLEAEKHHGGKSAVLHYNLACYDSLLGELASARARLATACRMDQRFKVESEDDPDLQALRDARRKTKR